MNANCDYWSSSLTDTYRITSNYSTAYLRIYPNRWRTRAEIQSEIDLLQCLRRKKAQVSYAICKNDGTFIDQIRAPEGSRYAVLFSAAKGKPPRMDSKSSYRYGELVGRIHALTDTTRKQFSRFQLDLDYLVHEPIDHVSRFLRDRPKDLAYLTSIGKDLAEAAALLVPKTSPQFGICHGDLHFGNLHSDSSGNLTLFDFDCCGYGWRAYDIGVFLWSRNWDFTHKAKLNRTRQWNNFLDGYQCSRDLSDNELQAAECFVPIRHIWTMGIHTNLQARIGQRMLSEDYFTRCFAFIKQWLKAYKPL